MLIHVVNPILGRSSHVSTVSMGHLQTFCWVMVGTREDSWRRAWSGRKHDFQTYIGNNWGDGLVHSESANNGGWSRPLLPLFE